jgi:GNAT superfamily N-acetyltransferase
MNVIIREGTIAEAVAISRLLPEFDEPPAEEEYHRRLDKVPHLILLAFVADQPAGFKVGYEKEGAFYSWMGGVLPRFRRRGMARMLADRQEHWAKKQAYSQITFKTRNQHKNMLTFALQNGFDIIGFKQKEQVAANRILLRKIL